MRDGDRVRLVCANALAPHAVEGSVYHHRCVLCGGNVMVAPSGQAMIAANPAIEIICGLCFQPDPDDEFYVTQAALKEAYNFALGKKK
jgi:hypothetical protein